MRVMDDARDRKVDLIVICSRRRTGLTRWLLGSLADRILRGTEISALLIPAGLGTSSEQDCVREQDVPVRPSGGIHPLTWPSP